MDQVTRTDFSGQVVFLGLDVHAKSIVVQPALTHTMLKKFTITPAKAEILIKKLKNSFRGAEFSAVYEAGFSGFWLQRKLNRAGIDCIVVNAADVPSSDKDRRRKSDQRDASKLVRELRNKTLEGLYIPHEQAERNRQLIRLRDELIKDERRCQQRIKAYLKLKDDLPSDWPTNWKLSKNMMSKLRPFANKRLDGEADFSLITRLTHLMNIREQLGMVNTQIKLLLQTEYGAIYRCLKSIPGIGNTIAAYLILEIIDMNRFANQDKLCAYFGLVPDLHASGERTTTKGITRRVNKRLRRMLIEATWTAIRVDPILAAAYGRYRQYTIANKAIIKVARKLLCRIRSIWLSGQPYQIANPG